MRPVFQSRLQSALAFLIMHLIYRFAFGQVTVSVNPGSLTDPRVIFSNPASISKLHPQAYLGLKLIYPGAVANNTFALKSSLFNVSTNSFAGMDLAGGLNGRHFTTPLYSETNLALTTAKSFGDRVSAGLNLGIYSRRYANKNFDLIHADDPVFRNSTNVTVFDPAIGILVHLNQSLRLGGSLLHFNRPNIALGDSAIQQDVEAFIGASFLRKFLKLEIGAHYWQNRFRPLLGAELLSSTVGRIKLGFALNNALFEGQISLPSNASLLYTFSLPTSDLGLISAGSHEVGIVYSFKPRVQIDEKKKVGFSLLANPNFAEIFPGQSAQYGIRLSKSSSRPRPVQLELLELPQGLKAAVTQKWLLADQSVLMQIDADSSIQPGDYVIRVSGKQNDLSREASLFLRVKPLPALFARLSATVDSVLITESRQINEELPLIPRVFFEKNSSKLAESRYDLLPDDRAGGRFSDIREINSAYRNLLNIIANRLNSNNEASIIIKGYSPGAPVEKNPEKLSYERAQFVRDYLVNTLNVERQKIQVQIGQADVREARSRDPLRLEELQRAEIFVDSAHEEMILAPILSQKKEIDTIPKRCGFIVSDLIDAGGLKNWALIIHSATDTVEVIRGRSTIPDTIWWDWQFDPDRRTDFWQTVNYSLLLEDQYKQRFKTPVKTITSRQSEIQTLQIEKIPIILFAFDEHQLDETSKRLKKKLKRIANKLKAETRSSCILYGYTDSIGETEHNYQLSIRRAQNVKAELEKLGVAGSRISFIGFGETQPLADNRLPEGRMINRRVEVHIRYQ